MRITQLTPGTGHFHCGNCLRENALARALRGQGHDVTMIPLYLPVFTEEPGDAPPGPVFLGGINMYLQHALPLYGRLPAALTRVLDGRGLLRWASRRADMTEASKHAALTVSMLRADDASHVSEMQRLLAWMREHDPPDIVSLCNLLLVGLTRSVKETLDVPVVCTMHGEDAFLDALPEPHRTEAWDLLRERARAVDAFVAVSSYYAERMRARLDLPAERVYVVHNGIALDDFTPAPADARARRGPVIGYLARMCEEKGLGTLVDAFIRLRERANVPDARLEVVGVQLKGDRRYVAGLESRLRAAGVRDAVRFHPNVDRTEKLDLLRSFRVLSVPATYGESFGLYVLEALAMGVPVVQPRHAAFPELLERTGGGVLCDPDDPDALAVELEGLLADPARADALGDEGRRAVHEHFTADRMAQSVSAVYHAQLATSVRSPA